MASFIKKKKPEKTAEKSDDGPKARTGKPTLKHPPLQAGQIVAVPNILCPLTFSSQGLSCDIKYDPAEKSYRITLNSKGKVVSDEVVDPTDRKKKAVTDFVFKGLLGIHVHPVGMLLTLDHEEDLSGKIRRNQPPGEIVSLEFPPGVEDQSARRKTTVDLQECTDDKPLFIYPNHGKYHMLVKPLANEEGQWGLHLSNPKGYVREDSPVVAILKSNADVLIDRLFFTSRTSGDGGIDARNWNKAIPDPVIMHLGVSEDLQLTIEDMYSSSGVTVLLEDDPISLGIPGLATKERDDAFQKQFADVLLAIKAEAMSEGGERVIEHDLAAERKRVIGEASVAIQKRNDDGISKLALELAIKEVLAPFYSDGGGDLVTHETIALLNAITGEIIGWLEADTSRALAVSAVEKAIDLSADSLPWEGIGEVMSLELPDVQANTSGGQNALFGELVTLSRKYLTSKIFVKQIRQLSKDLKASNDPEAQQDYIRQFDTLVHEMVTGTFERTLVCIAVQGYLIQTEAERRQALEYDLKQIGSIEITKNDINTIMKRYDSYEQFMARAFDDRLARSLDTLINDFQHGSNSEEESSISTSAFVTYLIALRNSGGKISASGDTASPSVSSLQGIPDAIPDISVALPDPGEPVAFVRVIHREGELLESEFNLAPRSDNVPEGVPNGLWYGFQDLAKFIVKYHLQGDISRTKDPNQAKALILSFSKIILQKVANFYRDLNNLPTSDEWGDVGEVIGKSTGMLAVVNGPNPEDEVLDIHNRPSYVSEAPLNIRHELRGVIAELEREGTVDMGIYQFKKKMRSFALTGSGKGGLVLLPIKMLAKGGMLLIRSKFNDEVFEKAIRLVKEDENSVGGVDDPFGLQVKKSVKQLSKRAIYKLIQTMAFFKQFSVYEKTKISDFDANFPIFHKGDVILREESEDIAFFIVIKGHVRALKDGSDLTKYGPGDMFGEMAFLTNRPQSRTVEALTNVLILRVDQDMFSQLGPESREKFKFHIINRQVRRLAETTTIMQQKIQSDNDSTKFVKARPPAHTNLDGEVAKIDRNDAIEKVDNLSFFDKFSVFEKRRMIAFFTSFRTYKDNSEIIREGMNDTSFFILISGEVQVIKGDAVIVEFSPGEFFGEMAFLINEARTTSVRSKGEVLALRMDPKLTEKLGPEIREKIQDQFIAKLTHRLTVTIDMLNKA
ncbi:MAG: cyclic nucleotide-binding domain-containing protein [Magnetococcales bacterium]|nr:cyclic nucleotide-binding domain-containing protein [Magnetococcales bacterium]